MHQHKWLSIMLGRLLLWQLQVADCGTLARLDFGFWILDCELKKVGQLVGPAVRNKLGRCGMSKQYRFTHLWEELCNDLTNAMNIIP